MIGKSSKAATLQAFDTLELPPLVQVLDAEYKRLLGFPPDHVLDTRATELSTQAREWYAQHGRPWICARPIDAVSLLDGAVVIDGVRFGSARLYEMLKTAEADSGVLVLVSAGAKCEQHSARLWTEEKPDEYLFLEMYGSAVAEHLVTLAAARLCATADQLHMAALPHYSPGYTGWSVADQVRLFSIFQHDLPFQLPENVRVLESGMLQPKKSLLAFFGLTRNLQKARELGSLVPCDNCALPNCAFRRAPFRFSRRMLQTAGSLQPTPPADPKPNYSLNPKALKKWSTERLKLNLGEDGSAVAIFSYDGTTCSNMGRPLRFVYQVRLGARSDGFPILEAFCAPATDDTNHQSMCAWIKDPRGSQAAIAEPPPLIGKRLEEVLRWDRPNNPAGCFCEFSARTHKWGLVLEVIHFALH